jgi:hypothetical protein
MLGRWHGPLTGWILSETDDAKKIYEWTTRWSDLLVFVSRHCSLFIRPTRRERPQPHIERRAPPEARRTPGHAEQPADASGNPSETGGPVNQRCSHSVGIFHFLFVLSRRRACRYARDSVGLTNFVHLTPDSPGVANEDATIGRESKRSLVAHSANRRLKIPGDSGVDAWLRFASDRVLAASDLG